MFTLELLCKNGLAIYEKNYEKLDDFSIMKLLADFDKNSGFKRKDLDLEKTIKNINKQFKMNIKAILTVEDDPTIRSILSKYGERTGHYIEAVETAEEAEILVKKHPFLYNIVLLDKNLPGLDGVSFGIKLKEFSPQVKAFGITGDISSIDSEYALNHGFERILEKPITLDAFRNATGTNLKKVA
jgi:CheY-like chemotaxis protein